MYMDHHTPKNLLGIPWPTNLEVTNFGIMKLFNNFNNSNIPSFFKRDTNEQEVKVK
jgi:hypothetical protein